MLELLAVPVEAEAEVGARAVGNRRKRRHQKKKRMKKTLLSYPHSRNVPRVDERVKVGRATTRPNLSAYTLHYSKEE